VLKITTTRKSSDSLTVHLCGEFTGEYVAEVEKAVSPDNAPQIVLDMSNVTRVDRKVVEFLCGMRSRISIDNVRSYVQWWMEQEFRCGCSQKKS
jgi:anti-anti-sigma regulatory factor